MTFFAFGMVGGGYVIGEGQFICQDGRSYVGEWKESKRHGKVGV